MEIIKNIFNTKIYLLSISLILIIIVALFLMLKNIIIPSYETQLINNIVSEAKKVGNHLSSTIDYENTSITDLNKIMKFQMNNFKIDKIHYFNKMGKVIYSTNKKKIGTVNKHSYFHEIVAKGNVYYKVKGKGDRSYENDYIATDIIEIYIPIMHDNYFLASFEMYYDITKELLVLNKLSNQILKASFLFSTFLVMALFSTFFILSKKNIEKKKYEEQLKYFANKDMLTDIYNRRYFYTWQQILLI